AERSDAIELVRDDGHGYPAPAHLLDAVECLRLEAEVAHGEDLIDHQHVGIDVRRDREAEPRVHPARVALDRSVYELLDLGERHDLVEAARDLPAAHPHDGTLQEHVLASR